MTHPVSDIPPSSAVGRAGFVEMTSALNERASAAEVVGDESERVFWHFMGRVHDLLTRRLFDERATDTNDVTEIEDAPDVVFLTLVEWMRDAPLAWQRSGYALGLLLTEAIWEPRRALGLPKRHELARGFVGAEIEAAKAVLDTDEETRRLGQEFVSAWRRIMEFAPSYGLIPRIQEERRDLLDAAERFLEDAPWWSVKVLQLVIEISGHKMAADLRAEQLERLKDLVDEAEQHIVSTESFYVSDDLVELRSALSKLEGTPRKQQDVARHRAEILVAEAEINDKHWMRACIFNEAAKHFEQAGERECAEEMKRQSIEEKRLSDDNGEMKSVSTSISFDKTELDAYIETILRGATDLGTRLEKIAEHFFVSILDYPDQPIPNVRSLARRLMTSVTFVDDRVKDTTAPDSLEQEAQEVHQALMWATSIGNIFIERAWTFFVVPLVDDPEDLVKYLMPDFEDENRELWLRLATAACESDWIVVMHIGAPRAERVVRETLRQLNEPTTSRDRHGGGLVEKSFGDLVRGAEESGRLSPQLARYLRCTLTEEWGLNLRNRVAHGLLRANECTPLTTLRLLHVLLLLRQWSRRARGQN